MTMKRQRSVRTFRMAGVVSLGLLCSGIGFAQQGERNRQRSDRNEQQQADRQAGQTELPQFLQDLELSSEQETKMKQTMREHNRKLRQTWREFHTTHAQAVELEAAWASAVRDSLSAEDQRKFDQQRMQDREMSKHSKPDNSQRDADDDRQTDRQQRGQDGEQRQQSQPGAQSASNRTASNQSQDADDRGTVGIVLITTASPERFLEGTDQTAQQKQQCSKACQEYTQKLTSVWQDLHQLHHELVKIEADRIQAIEEQLTEEQLTQLQENRQEPQTDQSSATSASQRSPQ